MVVIVVGLALLEIVSAGAGVAVTVTTFDVAGVRDPLAGVPVAVAWSTIEPELKSPETALYVVVNVADWPATSVVVVPAVQAAVGVVSDTHVGVAGAVPDSVVGTSVAPTAVIVTLPVFLTVKV